MQLEKKICQQEQARKRKLIIKKSLLNKIEEDQMSDTSETNGLDEIEKTRHLKICTLESNTHFGKLSGLPKPQKKWTLIALDKNSLVQQRVEKNSSHSIMRAL